MPKKITLADDFKHVQYVLPDRKTVGNYKHDKALQQEVFAAQAMIDKSSTSKVTLHFDTTSRSRVDGEWPSLLLNFKGDDPSDCKMLRLRALFFAHEDRDQIAKLIIETLKRLSVACGSQFSPKEFWEMIDAFMTDAVTKNLEVEKTVAERLESDHIPYHLLCKAHTCEKFDETCMATLVVIEEKLNIKELILEKQPRLRSFLNQRRCVALCAMDALLKLVSNESSGNPYSLSKEFDLALEEAGMRKSFRLYTE